MFPVVLALEISILVFDSVTGQKTEEKSASYRKCIFQTACIRVLEFPETRERV